MGTVTQLADFHIQGRYPPRGHRAVRATIDIALRTCNNDNFTGSYYYQVTIVWDSPQAGLSRSVYRVGGMDADPDISARPGQLLLHNVWVPRHGSLEVVAYPSTVAYGALDPTRAAGAVIGRCAFSGRLGRALRFLATRAGQSGSHSVARATHDGHPNVSGTLNLGARGGVGGTYSDPSSTTTTVTDSAQNNTCTDMFEITQQ